MILGIAHNALKVVDMTKQLQFFCEKVGFQKAFEILDDNGNPWIVYLKIADDSFLELFYPENPEIEPANLLGAMEVGYHHWCISVSDVHAVAERLHQNGVIDQPKAFKGRDGNYSVITCDADGNLIEFVEYDENLPQGSFRDHRSTQESGLFHGIAHLAFVVSDMDDAVDFYCNKLGFDLIYSLDDEQRNPWINYLHVKDGNYIELFYSDDKTGKQEKKSAGFMHMCLECDSVKETVEMLRKRGVTIDIEPNRGKDHNWQAWIHDPDGNPIELMTIHPDSPQRKTIVK